MTHKKKDPAQRGQNEVPAQSSKAEPSLKQKLKQRFDLFDPLELVAFRGYGTAQKLLVQGRLIEARGVSGAAEDDSLLDNISNTIRRIASDEIPGALIGAKFGGETWQTRTDNEGYFKFEIEPRERLASGWTEVELRLLESMAGEQDLQSTSSVLIPSPDAEFGVISDIDDTIIKTGASDRTTMIRVVLLENARSRSPFPGVARLYEELTKGRSEEAVNPIFYVSRSGWNLYDLFEEFFDYHGIPSGPMLLRDLAITEDASTVASHENHKIDQIETILATYPDLPFILIGDSGQKDPETYSEICRKHRQRIRAVYIRDVTRGRRDREVRELLDGIETMGIPALATEDTLSVAVHAADLGIIASESLNQIREARDEALQGKSSGPFRR